MGQIESCVCVCACVCVCLWIHQDFVFTFTFYLRVAASGGWHAVKTPTQYVVFGKYYAYMHLSCVYICIQREVEGQIRVEKGRGP